MASKLVRVTNGVTKKCLRQTPSTGYAIHRRHNSTPSVVVDTSSIQNYSNRLKLLPQTVVTTLDNGFRIATETNSNATATVGLWIDAGTRYELPQSNGVAHFLEHMIFKGTARRSQTDLELEVENMGAHLNAYTSREQTVYYAKCLASDIPQAVDILADITQNSTFSEDAIDRERGVILREMEEVERNMQEVVFDYLHATAFQGTPLAMTILGPEENINRINKADIEKYVADHYKPGRMVLAGAGGVDHDSLVRLAEKYFGQMKNVDAPYKSERAPKFTGSEVKLNDESMPLAHIALAVEGAAWDNPDNIPLMIANTIIGNYDRTMAGGRYQASKLASSVAELNLCHSFQSFNTCYNDTGLWGMYMVAEKERVEDIIEGVQYTWVNMSVSISEVELMRAKNLLLTNMMLMLDGTTPICEDIGRQMLCYGRRIPQEELQRRILNTTRMEVVDAMHQYIYDREIAIAGVGPIEGMWDLNRFRSNMYALRK